MRFALFRRVPADPAHLEVRHAGQLLPGGAAAAPDGQADHPARLERDRRGRPDHPRADRTRHGPALRRHPWRLDRDAARPRARAGHLQPGAVVPLRGTSPDRPLVEGPGRHAGRREPEGRAVIAVSGEPPHVARGSANFWRRRPARTSPRAVKVYTNRARRRRKAHHRARHQEPLGVLLGRGRPELLLAADPGAALRARLSRRPRGRASAGTEPFAPLLAHRHTMLCPRTEEAELWLKRRGSELHRFG